MGTYAMLRRLFGASMTGENHSLESWKAWRTKILRFVRGKGRFFGSNYESDGRNDCLPRIGDGSQSREDSFSKVLVRVAVEVNVMLREKTVFGNLSSGRWLDM